MRLSAVLSAGEHRTLFALVIETPLWMMAPDAFETMATTTTADLNNSDSSFHPSVTTNSSSVVERHRADADADAATPSNATSVTMATLLNTISSTPTTLNNTTAHVAATTNDTTAMFPDDHSTADVNATMAASFRTTPTVPDDAADAAATTSVTMILDFGGGAVDVGATSNASSITLETPLHYAATYNATTSNAINVTTATPLITTPLDFGRGAVDAVEYRFGLGVLLCGVLLVAVAGNVLVLLAICRTRALRRLNNLLLVSLAVSDFLSAVLCMPLFITELFNDYEWVLPRKLCSFYVTLELSFVFLSVWNIAAISLERVFLIVEPMLYQRLVSERRMLLFIAGLWLVSVSYGMSQLYWFNSEPYLSWSVEHPHFCRYVPSLQYAIADFLVCFILPLCIMFGAYQKIYCIVQSQMSRIHPRLSDAWDELPSDLDSQTDDLRLHRQISQMYSEGSPGNPREFRTTTSDAHDFTSSRKETTSNGPVPPGVGEVFTCSPDPDSVFPDSRPGSLMESPDPFPVSPGSHPVSFGSLPLLLGPRAGSTGSVPASPGQRQQTLDLPSTEDSNKHKAKHPPSLKPDCDSSSQEKGAGVCDGDATQRAVHIQNIRCEVETSGETGGAPSGRAGSASQEAAQGGRVADTLGNTASAWRTNEPITTEGDAFTTRTGDSLLEKLHAIPTSENVSGGAPAPTELSATPKIDGKVHEPCNSTSDVTTDADSFDPCLSTAGSGGAGHDPAGPERMDISLGSTRVKSEPTYSIEVRRNSSTDQLGLVVSDDCSLDPGVQARSDHNREDGKKHFHWPEPRCASPCSASPVKQPDVSSHTRDAALPGDTTQDSKQNVCLCWPEPHDRGESRDERWRHRSGVSAELPKRPSAPELKDVVPPEDAAAPSLHASQSCVELEIPDQIPDLAHLLQVSPPPEPSGCDVAKLVTGKSRSEPRGSIERHLVGDAVQINISRASSQDGFSIAASGGANARCPLRRASSAHPDLPHTSRPPASPTTPTHPGNQAKLHPVLKSSYKHVSTGSIPEAGHRKRNSVVFVLQGDDNNPREEFSALQQLPWACTKRQQSRESTDTRRPDSGFHSTPTKRSLDSKTPEEIRAKHQASLWARKHFNSAATPPRGEHSTTTSISAPSRHGSGVSSRRSASNLTRRLRENKAIRMTAAVIGAFVLCILPYKIVFLLRVSDPGGVSDLVWNVTCSVMFFANALNPFIYNFYNSTFRVAITRLLTCKRTTQVAPT